MLKIVWTLLAVLLAGLHAAAAQSFPAHPIRIIVPFSPGGTVDTAARLLQPGLQQALGQPILVENRPGADGAVGSALVAKSPPDGTTLLMVLESHAINAAIDPKLPYDTERDFIPITLVGTIPYVIITNDKVPARTLAEFVALARANPGTLNYASPASPTRLAAELFKSQNGLKIAHVAYRGGSPSVQSVVANETQVSMLPPFGAMPLIQGGQLRPLAVAGPHRLPALPDVPTTAEAGFPGFEATTWIGSFAPAGTPAAIVDRLHAETAAILKTPELVQRLRDLGMEVSAMPPADFRRFVAAEIAKWTKVARDNNITAEN
ncbi:MAG TPA: tripartite tricarboxylate transporter substrate binding protein [Alphaproteobacteria bacterium]